MAFFTTDPVEKLVGSAAGSKGVKIAKVISSLMTVRSMLPTVLAALLNRLLDQLPGTAEHIETVAVDLWDGRLSVDHFTFRHFENGITTTLRVKRINVVFQWHGLMAGQLLADIALENPDLEIRLPLHPALKRESPDHPKRRATDPTWQKQLRDLMPLKLGRLVISDGNLRLIHLGGDESGEAELRDVQMSIRNIVNRPELSTTMMATLELQGSVKSTGTFRGYAEGFPLAPDPTFNTDVEIKNVNLSDFNSLFRKYLSTEVKMGTMDCYAEAIAAKGSFRGYMKPLVDHLELQPLQPPRMTERLKIGLINLIAKIFKSATQDRMATKIGFSGKFGNPQIHYMEGALNFLKNAFVKTFSPRLEYAIPFWRNRVAASEIDADEIEKRPSKVSIFFSLVNESATRWLKDEAPRLGAALSYYTVFSLAPLLILTIAIVGLVFGQKAAEGQIVAQLGGLVGDAGAKAVQSMIQAARRPSSGMVATLVGVISLLAGATGVMTELKDALNLIWRAAKPQGGIQGIIRSRVLSLAMIMAIGFLLLVSLVVSATMAAAGKFLGAMLPAPEFVLHLINLVISFGVITLLFALIYKILPDTAIGWHDVWIGSAVTSALFSVGKTAIGLYLGKASVGSSYGAAGSVLVILLWVYYSAEILYFGAEFTKVYADRYGSRTDHPPNA